MTISTSTTTVIYRGNGSAVDYPVPFYVFDEGHLVVRRRVFDTGIIDTTYSGTDYSYAGIGDPTGTLTLAGDPLSDDYEIVIQREVPYTQDLDIVNAGGFYPDTVEQQLDLLEMQIQQVAEMAGRSIKLPVGMEPEDINQSMYGMYVAIDADGNPVGATGTGADSALRTDLADETGVDLIGIGNISLGTMLPVIPQMFGAVADNVTDCTQAIRDAIAALPAVGGWLHFPPGIYKISDQIDQTKDRCLITGKALIKAVDGSNFEYMMLNSNRTGVTIRDLEFDANKDGRSATQTVRYMGLGFNTCTDCTVDNVKVSGARGYDGVSAVGITAAGQSIRCKIINCQLSNCGDLTVPATAADGIFTSGEQNLIIGCCATNCTDTGAVIENSNQSGIIGGTYRNCGVGIGITALGSSDKSGNYATGFTVHNWDGSVGGIQVGIPDSGSASGHLISTIVSDFIMVAENVPTYGSPGPAFKIVGNTAGGGRVEGLNISNFRLRGSDTQGIAVVLGNKVRISNGYIVGTGVSCIQFDDGQGHRVNDCELVGGTHGIYARNNAEVIATDNILSGQTIEVMHAEDTARLDHRNNRFLSGTAPIGVIDTAIMPGAVVALTYGTTVAIDASAGPNFELTVTDGVAFAIAAPTQGRRGDVITITIKNASGGAMGAITWNAAFSLSAFTAPANGFNRTIRFQRHASLWYEQTTVADVPN